MWMSLQGLSDSDVLGSQPLGGGKTPWKLSQLPSPENGMRIPLRSAIKLIEGEDVECAHSRQYRAWEGHVESTVEADSGGGS